MHVNKLMSQARIARELGTHQSVISHKLRDFGIKTRPAGAKFGMKMPDGHQSLSNNSRWKGGIKLSKGRILLKKPDHPKTNNQGYVRRSHLVLEEYRIEVGNNHAHHRDGIRDNDSIDNLQVLSNSDHRKLHCLTQPRDESGKFRKVG